MLQQHQRQASRVRIPNPDSNSTRRPHRSHCADLVSCSESQVWGTRSARSRMPPNVPQKSCGCRWTSSDVPGTSEDANRLRKPKLQPLAGCLWTLLDVYGRSRMAPRAGFEVSRKFLSEQVAQTSNELDTPSDTPRIHALRSGVFARACDTGKRITTKQLHRSQPTARAWFHGLVSSPARRESLGNASAFRCLCALEPPGYLSSC